MLSVSYRIHDTDLWQLLVVGKAIWARHAIPATDQWTWVGFGDPQITTSWGFRALLWPVWAVAGIPGLFVFRWLTTLTTFALLGLAARRMGARGVLAFVVIAWAALVYRLRAEVRPESLVAVLLAAEVWILETWRNGGRDHRRWLIPLALVWANVHISYWLLFLVLGIHALDAERGRPVRGAALRRFLWIGAACAAVSFVNPFGARALIQPFEFAFRWRHEPMFRNVVELLPVNWQAHRTDGLPLLVAAWPLLAIARWRRSGLDLADVLACLAFTYLGISSQRFLGFYALMAAPFVARDLEALVRELRWPAWTRPVWTRAATAAVACLALGVAEWRRPELPLAIGIEPSLVPSAAAAFLERHDIEGRMFNPFQLGGYLAYRAWPGRGRLPFVTTQPENIRPEIRARYPRVFVDPAAWHALDRRYGFDIVVLARDQDPGDRLPDVLDADSSWALVFADDAAEVLVRRTRRLAPIANAFAYRLLPAGIVRRMQVVPAAVADTAYRARVRAELERMAAASGEDGAARHMLGILAMMDGRNDDARRDLERALAKQPFLPRVHELLGRVALGQQRPRDALREVQRERELHPDAGGLDALRGAAYEMLGDRVAARRAYERGLEANPADPDARAGLARVGG